MEEVYLHCIVLFLLQEEHFDRNLIDGLAVGGVRLYRSVAFAVLQIFRGFPVVFVAGGFGQSLELVTMCEEDVVKGILKLVLQLLGEESQLGRDFFLEGGGQGGVFERLESSNLLGCAEDGLSNEGRFRVEVHKVADIMEGGFVHFDYLGEVFDLTLQ